MLRGDVLDRCVMSVQWGRKLPLVLWMISLGACGPLEPGAELEEERLWQEEGLEELNGLSTNGLSTNGLSTNGLSTNGLSTNGLATAEFLTWFNADPVMHEAVMAYVVRCAMTKQQSLTYNNPATGQRYRWKGDLGLAPQWSLGQLPSVPEQQIVSACLAAHVNKFGLHVPLSVLGQSAQGQPVSSTAGELTRFSQREACFFGNLFSDQGLYAANDGPLLSASESTTRACGLSSQAQDSDCAPLLHVGVCSDFCTLDASGMYYTQCTYQGTSFLPITTRIQPEEIFQCGDGVCQFTEHCGSESTAQSCRDDCGACK
jgi:hypothetical protein